MCGIAGVLGPQTGDHREALGRMVEVLGHRGPDDSGVRWFPHCGLGHTRLAIIDMTSGQQPMADASDRLAITFNGEIYGYREIRRSLSGYPFQTTSDTELILALYERYGEELPMHLPGMFSFALWDDERQTLLCARDRFGEKPFYYAQVPSGAWVFASELKAIVASGLIEPEISRPNLVHYLRHLYVHPRSTIYKNVKVLPPAHALVLSEQGVRVKRYWRLPATGDLGGSAGLAPDEVAERFRELLHQAVGRQLVADVPVGAFLSGGLDSSTIVAAAAAAVPEVRTFSFSFGSEGADETPYARAVAERHGTAHTELACADTDLAALLVRMANVYDEPFADSSNIPTYLICQEARRHLKVVLTGDGGDELLAGYDFWYQPLLDMEQAERPSPWPPEVERILRAVWSRLGLAASRAGRGAALRRRYGTLARAHAGLRTYFNDGALTRLGFDTRELMPIGDPLDDETPDYDTVDGALRHDLETYMPGDILTKIDRASMAHGLELRSPFLDVDFASFCISLPQRLKIRPGSDKLILRQAFEDQWPRAVRERSKQGFGAPVAAWLARPEVAELTHEALAVRDRKIYDLIPFSTGRRWADRKDYRTWILLVLSLWLEAR